jgi:hypothetical protein
MSDIVSFYSGTAPDNRGRYVVDILVRDDDWLEHTHDYIH